jgi:hypothetical protein
MSLGSASTHVSSSASQNGTNTIGFGRFGNSSFFFTLLNKLQDIINKLIVRRKPPRSLLSGLGNYAPDHLQELCLLIIGGIVPPDQFVNASRLTAPKDAANLVIFLFRYQPLLNSITFEPHLLTIFKSFPAIYIKIRVMTTDILLDINQKDFLYDESNQTRTFFTAEYGAHQVGSDVGSYLDVIIPSGYSVTPATKDVYVKVPYIPYNTPVSIRFLRYSGSSYSIITVFGESSLPLYTYINGTRTQINACQLLGMDIDGLVRFHCISAEDGCDVFQACDGDFRLGDADRQAVELLTECAPGKNYRYPITGIGAQSFINSIIDRTKAAQLIQQELEGDGQTVRSVRYDENAQKLRIATDNYTVYEKVEEVDTDTLDKTAFE